MNYEIVKYRPEFRSQVVELQKHLWGPDLSMNSAYLEWKHEKNPYMETPPIYVALYEGKVVGMRGFCGAKWEMGSPRQTFLIPCACDLVVAPEHRRRGVFGKIMRFALDDMARTGYDYVFNLSGNQKNINGSLSQGWRSAGSLKPMRRKLRIKSISHRFQRYVGKLLPHSLKQKRPAFYCFDKNAKRQSKLVSPYVSMQHTPRPKGMAELVKTIGSDGRLRHVRDQQYFSWRFFNPSRFYRFLFWEKSDLEGYLILQTTRIQKNKLSVKIVDWEATDFSVSTDLLKAAIVWGQSDALNIWSATLSNQIKTLLHNIGFKHVDKFESVVPKPPTILIRSVSEEMLGSEWVLGGHQLLDLANWDFRMIYSDGS